MAELLPLFYWVHIDAPGQVSHEYTERERDICKHTVHTHTHTHTCTCIHSLLVYVTLHVPCSGNETTLMYIICKHIVTLWGQFSSLVLVIHL